MSLNHLAILTPGFANGEEDTICIPVLQDFILGLRRRRPGLRISIFAQRYPGHHRPYLWHGIPVHPAGGGTARLPVSLAGGLRTLAAMHLAARSDGPIDVVHAFWLGECAALARFYGRLSGARQVVTLMGQEVRHHDRYRRLLGRAGLISVAVSPWQRAQLRETGGPDVDLVIPWGVDPWPVPAVAPVRDIDLLFAGSLTAVKDPLAFVRVAAGVARHHPGLKARMIGDGPLLAGVRDAAMAAGIGDRLELSGALPRPLALDAMARARILLHTAEFESFCMVMVEARARGAVVLSRPVGIAAGLSDPGFVTAADEAGLIAAACRILSEPQPAPSLPCLMERTLDDHLRLYGA
ncbi:glycosyltransferase family 4 protein (plasmid) [Tistrella bauzanensis]|uniref:Glycosyltransferase family 4 protein n=1 Tax=Tistrella arctica TaxID=3133430 RepID=A0ABU9YKZ6_9PROT